MSDLDLLLDIPDIPVDDPVDIPDIPDIPVDDPDIPVDKKRKRTRVFNLSNMYTFSKQDRASHLATLSYDWNNPKPEDPWMSCTKSVYDGVECLHCNKVMRNRAALKMHMRSHMQEKQYKCRFCDVCFSHSTNLRAHERSSLPGHMGVKKWVCKHCPKAFAHTDSRDAHMRKAHGVIKKNKYGTDPYACRICDKVYANKQNRNRHMRKKHASYYEKTKKRRKNKIVHMPTSTQVEFDIVSI